MSWVLAFLLGNPIGKAFLGIVAAGALIVGAYGAGYWRAAGVYDARAQVAELQAANAALQQDLNAQRIAAEENRQYAAQNQRTAAEAQQRAEDYQAELAHRGDAAMCQLSGDDLTRLSDTGRGPR